MNEKHMLYILTVLKEGSFTAAARKLYVSQPSLSQIIKTAEANLGAPIFNRNTDPISLTPAGQLYVDAARQITTISTNLKKQIEELSNEEFGRLRLGISVQRGMEILPYIYPRFKKMFPHVDLELYEQGSASMERSVLEGTVSIALLTTSPRHEELVYDLIQQENLVLLVNKNCRLAGRIAPGTPIDIKEARDETFICSKPGHSVRTILDTLFITRDLKPRVGLETISIEVGKYVVTTSPVVMACPDAYADTSNHDSSPYYTYPILGVENPRHFYACYRKDTYLTKYMRGFLKLLHEIKDQPGGLHGQGERISQADGPDYDALAAAAKALVGTTVELPHMLNARERRVFLQEKLLSSHRNLLISFTLNIPGPVKVLPLVPDAFLSGISSIEDSLKHQGFPILSREFLTEKTGLEAFWAVDAPKEKLKQMAVSIEDGAPLGRLFDIDIIGTDKKKVSRAELGLSGRTCLICSHPAHACARSRAHTVDQLTDTITSILRKELT